MKLCVWGGVLVVVCLVLPALFAEETEEAAIKRLREITKTAAEPAEIARAHFEIGQALEKLGRETEATAEYLKIIINYPDVEDVNKKAEERLAKLYSGFSAKSEESISKYEATEGEKDPTIFFAYIKSLYENYRNLGQYDKALHVLERLYDIDPGNPSYLVDIGGKYLDGYNDADKAIFHFKKAIEIAPNNPKAYVDLGKAYEKKGDYESVINAYAKAAEISPASPWAMYGLKRIEGIHLARDKRLVKDWYILGPFDNSDREGLEKRFPAEEKVDLKANYTGKNDKPITWSRPFDYDASGYVDLNILISPNDYAVAYALTYVYSPSERKAQFRTGSDNGIRVWLNDEKIFNHDNERLAEADDDLTEVALKKGWNKILVKVSETWGSWGFYFRVTDSKGKPMEDLIFDPLKDDARLKQIYTKFVREKRFKITRLAMIYTLALSVFLLGLSLMISNIYDKVKITRMKEDFISSVSHELKTPLAAVKMLTETLKSGKIGEESRKAEYYDMIIKESNRLTRFIGKILDFSKLEKGGKIFYFEKANLAEIAKTAVDIYRDEAQDEHLKIAFNSGKDMIFAQVDKDAILQVILNLIDNAYKYSKKEKDIKVNVRESSGRALVEVEDKGSGISKEESDKIFKKFYRIEKHVMEGTKGSGIGLAFVRGVIDAHSGRIEVESEVGKGSKFTVSLPSERA